MSKEEYGQVIRCLCKFVGNLRCVFDEKKTAILIFVVFTLFFSGCFNQSNPKTFEPYKIDDPYYLEKVKNDLSSPYAVDLYLNGEVLFGPLEDAKIELVDYVEADEVDFIGVGKLKAGKNSKILYSQLKVKRLFGDYTNHIINSNILGLACDEDFSYCYSLDFRRREPEEGVIVGEGVRDFYVAGFVPKYEKLDYVVFYYVFYGDVYSGGTPEEIFYFAKFRIE